jgi:hypothetical protein
MHVKNDDKAFQFTAALQLKHCFELKACRMRCRVLVFSVFPNLLITQGYTQQSQSNRGDDVCVSHF